MNTETRLEQLERNIQYLMDRTAILDCIARNARGCDRHDPEVLAARGAPLLVFSNESPCGQAGVVGHQAHPQRVLDIGDAAIVSNEDRQLDQLCLVQLPRQDAPGLVGNHRIDVQLLRRT